MRMYDTHRGLMTALGAGVAGFLVWLAIQVGQQNTGRFWASMGIIAGAGLVLAFSQLLGGWTKWGWPRLSPGVFLLGFLPVLVCVGWILIATQPGHGWQEGRLVSWSHSIGIYGLVHALGLYHGVLALGLGLVLGFTFDTTGPRRRDVVVDRPVAERAPVMERRVADEPVAAEREEVVRQETPVGVGGRDVEIREDGRRVVREDPVDEDVPPRAID
jgi:hypothetical protein